MSDHVSGEIFMSDYRKRIGANIRHERTLRNISIDEFAEMLRLSTAFIGLIERGQRGAKLANLIKIAEIFGITVNDLIYNDSSATMEIRESSQDDATFIKKTTISSLLYGLDEGELDFLISTIRNLRVLKSDREGIDDEDESDGHIDY